MALASGCATGLFPGYGIAHPWQRNCGLKQSIRHPSPESFMNQTTTLPLAVDEDSLSAAELRAFLAQRLERYKIPDVFYFAGELPAGRTGKADRGRFAAMLDAGEISPVEER